MEGACAACEEEPWGAALWEHAPQDKRDDQAVGIRSTALLFGDQTKPILAGFAAMQVRKKAGCAVSVCFAFKVYGNVYLVCAWQAAQCDPTAQTRFNCLSLPPFPHTY
jgi:hypothetical protein